MIPCSSDARQAIRGLNERPTEPSNMHRLPFSAIAVACAPQVQISAGYARRSFLVPPPACLKMIALANRHSTRPPPRRPCRHAQSSQHWCGRSRHEQLWHPSSASREPVRRGISRSALSRWRRIPTGERRAAPNRRRSCPRTRPRARHGRHEPWRRVGRRACPQMEDSPLVPRRRRPWPTWSGQARWGEGQQAKAAAPRPEVPPPPAAPGTRAPRFRAGNHPAQMQTRSRRQRPAPGTKQPCDRGET